MKSVKKFGAAAALTIAFVGSLVVGGPGASAGNETTLTIHHRLCPTDQVISDYFTDCHDHLVGQSFGFTLYHDGGTTELTTDAGTSDGSATVDPGEVEISGGVPGEFAETFVYCSQDGAALDLTATSIGFSFTAPAGEVVCDWFNTPIDLSGGGDDDDDTDTGGVTALPNTGSGTPESASLDSLLMLVAGLGVAGLGSVAVRARRA